MLLFQFDGPLFRFNAKAPAWGPLFQFPPRSPAAGSSLPFDDAALVEDLNAIPPAPDLP